MLYWNQRGLRDLARILITEIAKASAQKNPKLDSTAMAVGSFFAMKRLLAPVTLRRNSAE